MRNEGMRNGLGTLRRSEAVLFVIPSEVEGSVLERCGRLSTTERGSGTAITRKGRMLNNSDLPPALLTADR